MLKYSLINNIIRKRFDNNNRLNIFIENFIKQYKIFSNSYFLYIIIERVNYTLT